MVKVEIKGNNLIITMPFNPEGIASKSGKSRVIASTHGNLATSCMVGDKPIIIGVNAYVRG